jgi:hypothetical protein
VITVSILLQGGKKHIADFELGKDSVIEQIPEEWSAEAEEKVPEQAMKFKELQQRLMAANEKRKALREKVESYRGFKESLDLFGEDAGVQSNLVTKNGEIEEELERTRRLMLRVERGLEGLEERNDDGEEMDIDMEGEDQRKLLALLAGT